MFEGEDGVFYARTSPIEGDAFIYVNDTIKPGADRSTTYYNNRNSARVQITSER